MAYDGANYHGFQKLGTSQPSIQGTLEAALAKVSDGQQVTVIGAGRTDSGVHATGQVIAFDMVWKHNDEDILRAVNAILPTDIALQRLERAAAGFHPRYDATSRTYQYFVYEAQIRQPMMARMSWWVRPPIHTRLDVDQMNWAAAKLLGTHDFASFGSPPYGENTKRQVYQSEWFIEVPTQGTRLLSYCIEANAFLYRMVRTIVGTLIKVGLHRLSIAEFIEIFQAKERGRFKVLAPPHGLTLTEVKYERSGETPAGETKHEI
ncbi:MAG: tRNA pseudouridine(38-40) synthase TruA [Chloroflexota bacterium]